MFIDWDLYIEIKFIKKKKKKKVIASSSVASCVLVDDFSLAFSNGMILS